MKNNNGILMILEKEDEVSRKIMKNHIKMGGKK